MSGITAVRVHCTLRALLRLKALPHTETPIFQLIVNKCGLFTGVEARATLVLTKDLCSSPQFLLPLFKPLVILITLTLPAECCAFLFSTCQGLEVSHLLFALFSQLNCSFQKRGLSLQAKHCAWGEKCSWLHLSWLLRWPKKVFSCETKQEFTVQVLNL